MNIPVETKPALWGMAGGAIAAAIIGFTWGGWVTGGRAETDAEFVKDATDEEGGGVGRGRTGPGLTRSWSVGWVVGDTVARQTRPEARARSRRPRSR